MLITIVYSVKKCIFAKEAIPPLIDASGNRSLQILMDKPLFAAFLIPLSAQNSIKELVVFC